MLPGQVVAAVPVEPLQQWPGVGVGAEPSGEVAAEAGSGPVAGFVGGG